MALEPGRRSVSPESSGRDSPALRQWRNQLGHVEPLSKDKHYRKYASGVDRALSLFDTALEEWADYISFLNRLLKALQARPSNITTIPAKSTVAKRLSQCLNPSLPSGVHQKALEVYNHVFSIIGTDGLSNDLPLYLPGLAPTLSFASLSVRTPFLDLLERHFLELNPRALRPAMKSIILAIMPGLEEETAEDFERTLKLMEQFKRAVRPPDADIIPSTPSTGVEHSTGDDFFWQCFFLASITGQSRRGGALAYLVRTLPKLGHAIVQGQGNKNGDEADTEFKLGQLVTSPEPGLLLRCFAAGLADDQLLIQRGYLDLLVTHLPLHSKVLQTRVKAPDLELLLRAAAGVTIRRDMSLNRRLWTWLLGPEPPAQEHEAESPTSASGNQQGYFMSRTSYFEEYGLQPLTRALLAMIKSAPDDNPTEKARPYRICLSLMDRWEIGGLVVPELFLPIVDSVRKFKNEAQSKADFSEVLRSASVFFDGVESGLIYGEMINLMAQAIVPGNLSVTDRSDKLDLVNFIMAHFNIREEEMITIHAPLLVLSVLCMLEEAKERQNGDGPHQPDQMSIDGDILNILAEILGMVPERAFPLDVAHKSNVPIESQILKAIPNTELLKKIRTFYLNEQGNLEAASPPLVPRNVGELLLQKACSLACQGLAEKNVSRDVALKSRILLLLLSRIPQQVVFDVASLLSSVHDSLLLKSPLPFDIFSATLSLATQLHISNRITTDDLSELVPPLVRHAWSFLSPSEPKYHVETVRNLWVLQTALTPLNRDIEAAICSLMLEHDTQGTYAVRPAEPGRTFSVLWSHTLQDSPSGSDRRCPRTPNGDLNLPRLAGTDNYDVMLTRPLFLMLDALVDDRTQLFMTAKNWILSLVGIDRIFRIIVLKLLELPFLARQKTSGDEVSPRLVTFSEDDDLDLALYYLRALTNIFRWANDSIWSILARKTISSQSNIPFFSEIAGAEGDITLQEFYVQVCLKCISCNDIPQREAAKVMQLYRTALTVLQQILSGPYAESLSALHLETTLIERLAQSLHWPDPYIQVLLLDVVYASLKLREVLPVDPPMSLSNEKRATSISLEATKALRSSVSVEAPVLSRIPPPPPSLIKCIQDGLSSPNSRPVLDSWISFLTESLPLYSDTIFQVLIPLVETFCAQIGDTFAALEAVFKEHGLAVGPYFNAPETTLISLVNGLEQVLARGHDRLLAEEARAQAVKSPDQPQGFFGNMVSGVFTSDAPHSRSATANDRLTVLLAFQDAVRICFRIWAWGQDKDVATQDATSAASFSYTSLRMRNRARRLLEHLFAAETLECLETVIGIWRASLNEPTSRIHQQVLTLLPALDGSRPRHTIPALFNALYSRTNRAALDPSRRSTLTIELQDTDIVVFLVGYAQTLDDDSMDEIWQDCMTFLRDLLTNPFPHRQTLPCLLEFAAILGEKVDNTNFGEQRKMRRELSDLFLRLLTAIFTTRPSIAEASSHDKRPSDAPQRSSVPAKLLPADRADDVVGILASIVPHLPQILVEPDRVLAAASAISTNIIGPALRSKSFPDTVSKGTLVLLQELARLPNNQKSWKKDVGDVFNDGRFFGSDMACVKEDWLPLLRQWTVRDKERMPEILSRITPPTTAGIVFGVGATSARLEADHKTQLNLRRIATLVLASANDTFVTDLPLILDKLVDLLGATSTSSPSSTTRAEVFMVVRALVLKTSAIHLAPLWPVINTELHTAISSIAAPDHSTVSDTYNNPSILQACKLLDLLVCVAPDDFQLHEWLFVTDTIDAVYRPSTYQPVALVDELSEELGASAALGNQSADWTATSVGPIRRTLLGPGGISDEVNMDKRDELVAKILRPFFGQLSIFAFESTYAMAPLDWEGYEEGLLRDLFHEKSIVRGL